MLECMDLRTIFDACTRETGYKGGGRIRVPWWRQEAVENQLKVKVEAILIAERVWRGQESSIRGGSKGGSEEGGMDCEG